MLAETRREGGRLGGRGADRNPWRGPTEKAQKEKRQSGEGREIVKGEKIQGGRSYNKSEGNRPR